MDLDYLQALMGGDLAESQGDAYRDIWVIAETRGAAPARVSGEILGRARELADSLGARLVAVLCGYRVAGLGPQLIALGADHVLAADDAALAEFDSALYGQVLGDLMRERKPEIVLLGATQRGRALAPRLAGMLNAGLITECVAVDIDAGERLLLATRASHAGALLSTMTVPRLKPQLATIRPGVLRMPAADGNRQGETETIAVSVPGDGPRAEVAPAATPRRAVPLPDARIVVAGGRGMGGAEGFARLEELAALLGGTVAASRSAVEMGWARREQMVDLTGTAVHPDLYIAVGISGAFPHRMATRGTRCLVAINRDAQAPIIKRADYALIADWQEALPAFMAALREIKER